MKNLHTAWISHCMSLFKNLIVTNSIFGVFLKISHPHLPPPKKKNKQTNKQKRKKRS